MDCCFIITKGLTRQSSATRKRRGVSRHPWLTQHSYWKALSYHHRARPLLASHCLRPRSSSRFLRDPVVPHDLPEHLPIHGGRPFQSLQKIRYSPEFHSKVCSTIILSVAVWAQQDLSLRNPASSSRLLSSRESFILSRMILQRTLLATERRIMPIQFLQTGSGTDLPSWEVQPIGPASNPWGWLPHCICYWGGSEEPWINQSSLLPGLWGMLSDPAYFPFFRAFNCLLTSALVICRALHFTLLSSSQLLHVLL